MVSCFHVGDSFVEVRGGLTVVSCGCPLATNKVRSFLSYDGQEVKKGGVRSTCNEHMSKYRMLQLQPKKNKSASLIELFV